MHVAVVGGGVFGAALAWRLAVRDHSVMLLEPSGFGHAGSASGDRTRIVRALYDDPHFAASGQASLGLFARWSQELGVRLVEDVGVLYLNDAGEGGAPFRAWVDQGIGHVRRLGGDVDELTPAEVSRRYPALDVTGLERGVLERGAGYGRAALAARTFAAAAMATGRVQHIPVRATEVKTHAGAASSVAFHGGSFEAELVIVAAGVEGAKLVEPLTGDLGVRRLPHWTAYFRVEGDGAHGLASPNLPCWADLGNFLYGFPDAEGAGFKVAWHEPRRDHPGGDGAPTKADLARLQQAAARRFPAMAKARCIETFPCAYDATPDERFLVGPVPGVERLWFVGGLSGHGFKHAPAIAEAVAARVSGEDPALDISAFALQSTR